MTTLFPQIKRVEEDETSKILKNVLFDDQDEAKLEQIFDEFMHLTKESIPSLSDMDLTEDMPSAIRAKPIDKSGDPDFDGAEQDEDGDPGDDDEDNDDDDDDDDDEDEDDDDGEDEDDDDDDDDDDDSESDSESENEEVKPPIKVERTSWNLDQFISKPNPVPPPARKPSPQAQPVASLHQQDQPKQQPQATTQQQPQATTQQHHQAATQQLPQVTTQQPLQAAQQQQPQTTTQRHSQSTIQQQQPSSGSFMVQIDLSKLKRIPNTKAPTPTTSNSKSMITAKTLKHEADAEKDKTLQAIKYLESAMYFTLHGYEMETSTNNAGYQMYNDTIQLFKFVLRLSNPSQENQDIMTNLKIHTLGLKCLSLVHMKLYKSRERELTDNNKTIHQYQNSSPIQQTDGGLIGVKPQLLAAYKRSVAILQQLRCANEYWQQADQFCDQHPAVRIFFSTIESNCGSLSMLSPVPNLMDHVRCGLKLLRAS